MNKKVKRKFKKMKKGLPSLSRNMTTLMSMLMGHPPAGHIMYSWVEL